MIKKDGLILDGNSWKDKENTTYTSILDLYGISDLFSGESSRLYEKKAKEENELQEELQGYVFSDFSSEEGMEEELTEYIFSDTINVAKVKTYNAENKENTFYIIGIGVVVAIIFIVIINKYNRNRKKRREEFATEINMESIGAK